MAMDIIICLIIFLSAVFGARKGFALTVISFLQWFVCLIVGIILCSTVKDLIYEYTNADEYLNTLITAKISESVTESTTYNAIPGIFSSWIKSGTDSIASQTAAGITSVILTIASFLLILIGIKLMSLLLTRLFSKKHHKGFLGFIDGLGGFAIGFVRGWVLALVFLALLVPLLSILWPELSTHVLANMKESELAGYLYENNILLIFIKDLFSL